ncbi:methylmalonyl Co-A mutase-associated GTPase MeaB [Halobacteriales archaeon QS_8_69_26]|nr:MAG: methylmalonyl Co-A mutase-associated GTPase MeaB [Halobacteriales archaeon QS_8_69_26]
MSEDLYDRLVEGDHRALARAITNIENRAPGYRDLVSKLYAHAGDAEVIGITGSPGSGKSTLVDKLAVHYRERGETVGVIAVDPSSPFTGGAVLGDRVRMASNVGDMDVFVRSMSARGTLGGLSTATSDAVKALDAFGKDVIIIETVGAGQNEIDIVRTADTVAVLVPPGSGDSVQTLKAGILEIGDVFVVNKADKSGADRTVQELREMIQLRPDTPGPRGLASPAGGDGHHGHGHGDGHGQGHGSGPGHRDGHGGGGGHGGGNGHGGEHGESDVPWAEDEEEEETEAWVPRIVETVATKGEGVEELVETVDDHHAHLVESGQLEEKARTRTAEEIRTLLRQDTAGLLEGEVDRRGGMDDLVDAVLADETDPYTLADELIEPLAECLADRPDDGE